MGQLYVLVKHGAAVVSTHVVSTDECLIGRSRNCDIRLQHSRVSRCHASIKMHESGFTITDNRSRHGTWIDGERIHGETRVLANSDVMIGPYNVTTWPYVGEDVRATIGDDSTPTDTGQEGKGQKSGVNHLTPGQLRVYWLLLEGLSEKEVANRLQLSVNTVHDHTKAIYKALSVTSRGELFAYARRDR